MSFNELTSRAVLLYDEWIKDADYKRGFGGKYGVEVDKQDKCALGYEHKEKLAKHESQQGTVSPLASEQTCSALLTHAA